MPLIEDKHLAVLRDFIRRADVRGPLHDAVIAALAAITSPVPLRLHCPECRELHVDEGDQATRSHRTHACQHCGHLWAPAVVETIGVRFLPGCRNFEPPVTPIQERTRSLGDHVHGCGVDSSYSWLPIRCAPDCPRNPLRYDCPTCGVPGGTQCLSTPPCTIGDFGPEFHEKRAALTKVKP